MVSPGAGGGDAQDSGTERMSIMSSKEEKGGRTTGPINPSGGRSSGCGSEDKQKKQGEVFIYV